MARTDPQVNFRLPEELMSEVRSSAEKNGRTVTAEVAKLLRAALDAQIAREIARKGAHIRKLERQLAELKGQK